MQTEKNIVNKLQIKTNIISYLFFLFSLNGYVDNFLFFIISPNPLQTSSPRLYTVGTACSWSTPTACWTRTGCASASPSCRPTWSSCRGSWRESRTETGSRCSRAAPVWTVWVELRLEVQFCSFHHHHHDHHPHAGLRPSPPSPVPPVTVQRGPVLRPLLLPRPGTQTSGG